MKKRGELGNKDRDTSREKTNKRPFSEKVKPEVKSDKDVSVEKKGWHGEKEKHILAGKGMKISKYKGIKVFFSLVFVLGFLMNLVTFFKSEFFVFNLIGLPLILFSFFGYHYLTKLKEHEAFKRKRRFIDYVSLFLFVFFFLFAVLFFLMERWLLMGWGALVMCLTLLFYAFLVREKIKIKKVLVIIIILFLAAGIVFFIKQQVLFKSLLMKMQAFFKLVLTKSHALKSLFAMLDFQTWMIILVTFAVIVLGIVLKVILRKKAKRKEEAEKKGEKVPGEKGEALPKLKKGEVRKIKLRKTELGETGLDILYEMLKERKELRVRDIAGIFGITQKHAEDWCKILEKSKLAELHFPLWGGPRLRVIKNEKAQK